MSVPKVPSSSKSKDSHDSCTGFERAALIFQEIEAFLETELAETPSISASYEIPRSKSKRKRGPFLIRPLNKSKARKTWNDMEYDPVSEQWKGNETILKGFAGRPALITNTAQRFRPKSDGKMVWNAKDQVWEGNYEDVKNFEKPKRPLIRIYGDPNVKHKEINGMTFDPVTMTWMGNHEALLDFGTISEEASSSPHDDGFAVGTEFQLSPATMQLFTDCAARHAASTTGWWRDEKTREHLAVIRTMSIMRLVRDTKRAAFAMEEPSFMDIAVEKEPLKLKSPRAEPEVDFDDAWEDVGPFQGAAKIKLREATDLDLDLDQELSKFGSIRDKSGKFNTIVDEDWDDDFASEDLDRVLPRKLSTHKPIPSFTDPASTSSPQLITPPTTTPATYNGTITQLGKGGLPVDKKPFALLKADAPHRRSFRDLGIEKSPKVAWEAEDEDGLEIPTGPLQLKLNRTPSISSTDEEPHDEDFDDTPSNHEEAFDEGEVEEEDWDDVAVPPALGEPVTRRPDVIIQQNQQPPEKEEWDDFEIPSEKLELKLSQHKLQQHPNQKPQQLHKQKSHRAKAEEEDLDGLDVPEGLQLRLKR